MGLDNIDSNFDRVFRAIPEDVRTLLREKKDFDHPLVRFWTQGDPRPLAPEEPAHKLYDVLIIPLMYPPDKLQDPKHLFLAPWLLEVCAVSLHIFW